MLQCMKYIKDIVKVTKTKFDIFTSLIIAFNQMLKFEDLKLLSESIKKTNLRT